MKLTPLAAILCGSALSTCALAASTFDMVVAIDESGSMSGEQDFIGSYIKNIDQLLNDQGVTLNQFGLMGFGGSPYDTATANEGGRETTSSALYHYFTLDTASGANFGSSTELDTVTSQLAVSGSTEDGYRAIDYIYRNYEFRANAGSSILLITDEDRDDDSADLTPTVDKAAIVSQLTTNKTVLHVVVSQHFTDKNGNTAIAVVGADPDTGYAYVEDSNGVISKVQGYILVPTYDTTQADYTEIALSSGGTAMDIEQLRSVYLDPTALAALSAEFAALIAQIASEQPSLVGIDCDSASGAAAQACAVLIVTDCEPLQEVASSLAESTDPEVLRSRLRRLTPVNNGQLTTSSMQSVQAVRRLLSLRLGQKRMGMNGVGLVGVGGSELQLGGGTGSSGGAASADASDSGMFIQGIYSRTKQGASGNADGYKSDNYSLVLGFDRYVSSRTQVGAAFGYSNADASVDNGDGSNADTYSLMAYSSYEMIPALFLETVIGYSNIKYDTSRNTGFGVANGDTHGDLWSASVGVSKDLVYGKWGLQPFVRLDYSHLKIKGYTESGSSADLSISSQSTDSVLSEVGSRILYTFNPTTQGELYLAWEHEFNDGGRSISAVFAGDPSQVLKTDIAGNPSDYARIGVGVRKDFNASSNLTVRIEGLYGNDDYREHSLQLRYNYQF
ncbi:hypothetical protein C4K68_10225 [Pokkaliibacter plantistimulans]|uniref:Autotransporter domain-containing protein n=1 Tax=Proteobacteria bacterium 228 TaxID=2083153 RepID=A0A2S5KRV6_9PROT|nr:autotransporter outer membrane beta-barrel domain-containing protein [Pokkaliibacter plantistimulans]PPC77460.1 hypothetical protein C4K68_10225 [Pokkaliibacter plantistimulans]